MGSTMNLSSVAQYPRGVLHAQNNQLMNNSTAFEASLNNDNNRINSTDTKRKKKKKTTIKNVFLPDMKGPLDTTHAAFISQIVFTAKTVTVTSLRKTLLRILSNDVVEPISLSSLGGLNALRSLLLLFSPRQMTLHKEEKEEVAKVTGMGAGDRLQMLNPLLIKLLRDTNRGETLRTFLIAECIAHLLSASHPTQTQSGGIEAGEGVDEESGYQNDRAALTSPNIKCVHFILHLLWQEHNNNTGNESSASASSFDTFFDTSFDTSGVLVSGVWNRREVEIVLSAIHNYIKHTDGRFRIKGIQLLLSFVTYANDKENAYYWMLQHIRIKYMPWLHTLLNDSNTRNTRLTSSLLDLILVCHRLESKKQKNTTRQLVISRCTTAKKELLNQDSFSSSNCYRSMLFINDLLDVLTLNADEVKDEVKDMNKLQFPTVQVYLRSRTEQKKEVPLWNKEVLKEKHAARLKQMKNLIERQNKVKGSVIKMGSSTTKEEIVTVCWDEWVVDTDEVTQGRTQFNEKDLLPIYEHIVLPISLPFVESMRIQFAGDVDYALSNPNGIYGYFSSDKQGKYITNIKSVCPEVIEVPGSLSYFHWPCRGRHVIHSELTHNLLTISPNNAKICRTPIQKMNEQKRNANGSFLWMTTTSLLNLTKSNIPGQNCDQGLKVQFFGFKCRVDHPNVFKRNIGWGMHVGMVVNNMRNCRGNCLTGPLGTFPNSYGVAGDGNYFCSDQNGALCRKKNCGPKFTINDKVVVKVATHVAEFKCEEGDLPVCPTSMLCGISGELMVDPVTAGDGNTYDRGKIEKWLDGEFVTPSVSYHWTSPVDGESYTSRTLTSNTDLKEEIKDWKSLRSIAVANLERENQNKLIVNMAISVNDAEFMEVHFDGKNTFTFQAGHDSDLFPAISVVGGTSLQSIEFIEIDSAKYSSFQLASLPIDQMNALDALALKRKSKSEWWRYEGNEFENNIWPLIYISDVKQDTFTVSNGITTRDGAERILMEEQEIKQHQILSTTMKTMEASELEAIAEQDLKEEDAFQKNKENKKNKKNAKNAKDSNFLQALSTFTKEDDIALVRYVNSCLIKHQKGDQEYRQINLSHNLDIEAPLFDQYDEIDIPLTNEALIDYRCLWKYNITHLRLRLHALHALNQHVYENLSFLHIQSCTGSCTSIDTSTHTSTHTSIDHSNPHTLGSRLLKHRHLLYTSTKMNGFSTSLKSTMTIDPAISRNDDSRPVSIHRRTANNLHVRPAIGINRFQVHKHPTSTTSPSSTMKCTNETLLQSVFGQTWSQLQFILPIRLRQLDRAWHVNFTGEHSVDVGGPYREVLSEMISELQEKHVQLFVPTPNHRNQEGDYRDCYLPNPNYIQSKHLSMYFFLGQLMGVAVRTHNPIALHLPPMIWKLIVGQVPNHKNVKEIDVTLIDYHNGLLKLTFDNDEDDEDDDENDKEEKKEVKKEKEKNQTLKNDIRFEQEYSMSWITKDALGRQIHLTPPTTATTTTTNTERLVKYSERHLYVTLAEKYRTNEFNAQCVAIRNGMSTILPMQRLSLWTWYELEKNVCGDSSFDLTNLMKHTRYKNGLNKNSKLVIWLWKILESFDVSARQNFLRFVWGRTRLPLGEEGWLDSNLFTVNRRQRSEREVRKLEEMDEVAKGKHEDAMLPEAHTCFNQFFLPNYTNMEVMKERILFAITYCSSIDTDDN